MFYVVLKDIEQRTALISMLKENEIHAVFHYISLHSSDFYHEKHDGRILENSDKFTNCLVRFPLFYELETTAIDYIINLIKTTGF